MLRLLALLVASFLNSKTDSEDNDNGNSTKNINNRFISANSTSANTNNNIV